MSGTKPKRTREEQQILLAAEAYHGKEYVEKNAEWILKQARAIGNL